jgi:hypothetical protein
MDFFKFLSKKEIQKLSSCCTVLTSNFKILNTEINKVRTTSNQQHPLNIYGLLSTMEHRGELIEQVTVELVLFEAVQ